MKPGDIIFWEDKQFGVHRFYRVEGCHLGAVGQESLIELRCLTEKPGTAYGKDLPATTMVPEPLVRNLPVYSDHGAA